MKYFLSLCLLILLSMSVEAKPITLLSDDPKDLELFFKDGRYDIASDSYRLLLQNLVDVEFELKIAPTARIDSLLRQNKTICAVNRIKTEERLLYNLYSYPVHLYPSHRLYYFKDRTPLLDSMITQTGELINLNKLFGHYTSANIAIETGRSYGKNLDQQLTKLNQENILFRAGSDAYEAMIKLFQRHRVDFLISYPTIFKQYYSDNQSNIASVAIARHPLFIAGHIACSSTPRSEKIIAEINKALLKIYPTEEYLSMHLHHVPNTEQSLLTRRISDLFLKYKLLSD
ncbi:hypothetical protein [Pseudoalteromonas phenolica]|nr:hypothetical protein [Pseudoalteromonas phenolica]